MKTPQNILLIGLLGFSMIACVSFAPQASFAATPSTSENWSGYVATNGTFTGVTGTWTVPQAASSSVGADAAWVGIGGMTGSDLIQAGTQEIVGRNGGITYQAWIETLPSSESVVPMTIAAGDAITASITASGTNVWEISLVDARTGVQYQTSVDYESSLSSAEWIEEMPTGSGTGLIPLDDFGSIPFSNASATENGSPVTLAQSGAQPLTMTNNAGQALATPSAIGEDGASFAVVRSSVPANIAPQDASLGPRTWRRTGVGIEGYTHPMRQAGWSRLSRFRLMSASGNGYQIIFRF